MVKLTLYGNKMATCTQHILILLEELDLKYDLVSIDLMKGEHKTDEYMKKQPFGKVPVVEYDEHTLFESRSILRYISKNNTDYKDLTLNDNPYVDMWLEVESQNFNPPMSKFIYETVFKQWKDPNAMPDHKVLESAINELRNVLDVYELRLDDLDFIGGNEFSIADISHIPYLHLFVKNKECKHMLKRDYPNVYGWYKKMLRLDSVKNGLGL